MSEGEAGSRGKERGCIECSPHVGCFPQGPTTILKGGCLHSIFTGFENRVQKDLLDVWATQLSESQSWDWASHLCPSSVSPWTHMHYITFLSVRGLPCESHWATINVSSKMALPSGGSGGKWVGLPFSASRSCPCALADDLFLQLQSQYVLSLQPLVTWPSDHSQLDSPILRGVNPATPHSSKRQKGCH
uniref:Uncharacterized protein n=1 Tax=Pipistrellus kuhlii TaxID=59472 RepID=A0A7J7ZJ25_PIPKU|nr:hypothetical protein mPipKuh1_009400 [Pipistrellus kuhlii]